MAQSVKHLTLDLGSGHDLTVGEFEPRVLGGPDGWASDFGSGLMVSDCEPCTRLSALCVELNSEISISVSLPLPHLGSHMRACALSKINKR